MIKKLKSGDLSVIVQRSSNFSEQQIPFVYFFFCLGVTPNSAQGSRFTQSWWHLRDYVRFWGSNIAQLHVRQMCYPAVLYSSSPYSSLSRRRVVEAKNQCVSSPPGNLPVSEETENTLNSMLSLYCPLNFRKPELVKMYLRALTVFRPDIYQLRNLFINKCTKHNA